MFRRLRTQLLLSHTTLIVITLMTVTVVLLILVALQWRNALQSYRYLRVVAQDSQQELGRLTGEERDAALRRIADTNGIRMLRLARSGTESGASEILYDSMNALNAGQVLAVQTAQPEGVRAGNVLRGSFQDPTTGDQFIYLAAPPPAGDVSQGWTVFAIAATQPEFVRLLANANALVLPLFQAGVVSLIVAVILAAVISRSVSRPLSHLAEAARAVGEGNYQRKAPLEGPLEIQETAVIFNEMTEQVQRTQKAQQEFLASVSHDLKTPLTSIQGYSQAILDGAAAQPERAAQVIYDEAARMRRMVDELLDLARIQSGQAVMTREYVSITALVEAVIERLQPQAEDAQVRLLYRTQPDLKRVTGDGDRLAQVFTNLIDNAIGHTPAGGRVTVDVRDREGGIEASVTDTGEGIPQEDLAHIFERFYQVDKSRSRSKRKGTGLGLTIVKEIVEAHDGHIRVESASGQGASFIVWLPRPRPSDLTVRNALITRKR